MPLCERKKKYLLTHTEIRQDIDLKKITRKKILSSYATSIGRGRFIENHLYLSSEKVRLIMFSLDFCMVFIVLHEMDKRAFGTQNVVRGNRMAVLVSKAMRLNYTFIWNRKSNIIQADIKLVKCKSA